ncbi:flagellar assembly protein FliX [Pelagibacterium lacus]|nr:flagellar assembly protein FliX [Pelagibacterium lacus]
MRIDGTGRIHSTNRQAGPARAGAGGEAFRPEAERMAVRSHAAGASVAAAGIDALLALQAVDDATTGRRKAVRRGNQLLDALEDMQTDLLLGRVGEGRLNRAVALLRQAKTATEPGLDALLADIELRVRVELAKLGQYPAL